MQSTTRIFRPMMNAGQVYARAYGSAMALQSIGGVSELSLKINEDVKKQQDFSRAGGGTRATVHRINSVMMAAKLQDLNPVNLARACFGLTSAVLAGTTTAEAVTAYKGGLIRLEGLNPTSVIVHVGAAVVPMESNYVVLPEGIMVLDNAAVITDGEALTVDYAHSGYDVIEALTTSAPTLQMVFAGINEAMNEDACIVDLFRVQTGAMKSLGLINKDFTELEIEGDVLLDPTITGAGNSRFFKVRIA